LFELIEYIQSINSISRCYLVGNKLLNTKQSVTIFDKISKYNDQLFKLSYIKSPNIIGFIRELLKLPLKDNTSSSTEQLFNKV